MPCNTFNHFPAEIRQGIIMDVMATKSARSLLAALRVTPFYAEALEFYYRFNFCILQASNLLEVEAMSSKTHLSVQMLKVNFRNVTTVDSPRRWGTRVKYAIHMEMHVMTKITMYEALTHTRIAPKPSMATLAPFANVRILHINASLIEENRFHQIEGMLRQTTSKFENLERLEVRDDMADLQWGDVQQSSTARASNDGWVERFNAELGLPARLLRVSNDGCMVIWFWVAGEGKKLTWKK